METTARDVSRFLACDVFAQGNRGLSESCGRLLFSAPPAYMNGMAADHNGHSERVKELVRQHWNRRAADFDLEASHGLLTDAQAHA